MDISKFVDFLINQSFHLTRLDGFEDKSEGISQRQLAEYFEHDVNFPPTLKTELDLEKRQQRYFASCWFSGKRESIGMWNLYSNPSSIAIKIAIKEFNSIWIDNNLEFTPEKKWINHIYIDKIDYKNYLSIDGVNNFKDSSKIIGFQKDESFNHENEVRVLIKCKGKDEISDEKFADAKVIFFKVKPLNITQIPFKVIFHPLMQEWQKNNIKNLISNYKFDNIITEDSELRKFFKPFLK